MAPVLQPAPITFKPLYVEKVWGGRALNTILGKDIPKNLPIGESWEISAISGSESNVASAPYIGMPLSSVVAAQQQNLLGTNITTPTFPLLYKFIDANDKLSIQVHPNDMQAQAMELGNYGKTECWYIVDTKPGTQLICGFKDGVDMAAVQKAIADGCLPSLCNYIDIQAGDVVFVPAGTMHATLSGTLLYEIQQSSDTTFRFYDWDRVDDSGKPRALHIKQALEVLDTTYHNCHVIHPVIIEQTDGITRTIRVACRYFALEEYSIAHNTVFTLPHRASFQVITVLSGSITLRTPEQTTSVGSGDSALIPANLLEYTMQADAATHVLVSYVPDIATDIVAPIKAIGIPVADIEQLGGNPARNDVQRYL